MRNRLATSLLFSFSLAGCGTVNRTIEPEPILPRPDESVSVPLVLTSDGKVQCQLAPIAADGSIPTEMQLFAQAAYCAYSQSGTATEPWIRRFVEKGIALSDRTCGLFFDSLERRRVDSAYYQTNMNVAGTAVTAILAAAGNNARSVFNVATALAVGNAWFENYKANYVLTPQLGKLHRKLQSEIRKPIGDAMREKSAANGYTSFDLAKSDLQSYDELCSHKAIVYFLEEAITVSKFETYGGGPSENDVAQADVLRNRLYAQAAPAAPGTFSKGQVEQLFVVANSQNVERRKQVAQLVSGQDAKVGEYIKLLKFGEDVPDADAVALVISIGRLLKFSDSTMVRQYQLLVDQALDRKTAAPVAASSASSPANPGLESLVKSASSAKAEELARWSVVKSTTATSNAGVNFNVRGVRPPAGQ